MYKVKLVPDFPCEGSFLCLVAVLSCYSDAGWQLVTDVVEVERGRRHHHLCLNSTHTEEE